uniref:Amino acid/amide ABC transporter substrate-binding protein, HAAT family (TC 3.A.1.4.-) n=1 Tax=Candidatus Kentrum eta TaxID=2126337 RepID=A0A450V6H8_9GAMM|nr:MAG: amino acid/amide ABC transporter substrate-binding protein, HAAT family (TC 3.A.1.4.-) [Candidatus Kentron sp. H]VFK00425.1 MAG: amino acid/amide ABC transporter substrate-binding protein, HAAT family (TC 3.A.1.4.-) [Candidatus Kentron sp. H]VFK04553.1 MAG: amino acid/amide ABC transporter substrate-binding protein, HAAT family (TC 3.A.1.4.-) [Candidatus Kentron sp. H]
MKRSMTTMLALSLLVLGMTLGNPVMADLVIPLLSFRTGPYAPNGIPYADGITDYLNLLNERDGGVGGERIEIVECETAYNTQQGVECYENTKGKGALVYFPLSTGISYQLIPKTTADGIPLHTMGYGRTSAANGNVFTHVFNFPGTYWDAASILIKYIGDGEGGMDNLSNKTIALIHHNSPYGKEPIRTLENLSAKHGFTFKTFPVDHPGQEQKSTWLQVRRNPPDYILLWGWGVMNQVAIKEAASIRFPMDKFIGVWWSSDEGDVLPAGLGADGYKAITFTGTNPDYPVYEDLDHYIFKAGKAAGDGSRVGTNLYNRGILQGLFLTEAIKTAQALHGVTRITPAMMRDGLENLEMTEEKYIAAGLPGFSVPFKVTCENHAAPGLGAIQQWDAKKKQWKLVSGFIASDREIVDPLIMEDSMAYGAEAGIPTDSCK